jgi:hypothetical protein
MRFSHRDIGHREIGILKGKRIETSQVAKSRQGSGPFVWEWTRVTRLPTSGTRAPRVGRGSHSTSRVAKRRELRVVGPS